MAMISIIVPVYNVEKYLRRCLDSLINQTFCDIEIICIDDGSTDHSLALLKEYEKKDMRIKVVHSQNQGVSGARNLGLSFARAPYIMFCDPDDEYRLVMCERMYGAIKASESDFVRCGVELVRNVNGDSSFDKERYFDLSVTAALKNDSYEIIRTIDCTVWNKIFRRELIEKYDISFKDGVVHEDLGFYIKYVLVSKKINLLSDKLYCYILRENGLTGSSENNIEKSLDRIRVLGDIYEFIKCNSLWETCDVVFLRTFAFLFDLTFREVSNLNSRDTSRCYDLAAPVLLDIGKEKVLSLLGGGDKDCIALLSILSRHYIFYGKRCFGIVTLKSKVNRFEVRILGVRVYLKRRNW
jgi:glycosyltransferase involved in cell wall biosynthesis